MIRAWARRRAEQRRAGYGALIEQAISSAAFGGTWAGGRQRPGDRQLSPALAHAPFEAAAGLLGRSLAACAVQPGDAASALTPRLLHQIGRDLVLRGQWLAAIDAGTMGLRLLPSSHWDVEAGGPEPESWTYRVTLAGPSETVTRTMPAAAVVHLCWASSAWRPWEGMPAAPQLSETGRLLANAASSASDELRSPIGQIAPLPAPSGRPEKEVHTRLREFRGDLAAFHSVQGAYSPDGGAPPVGQVNRFGPQVPGSTPALLELAAGLVNDALGMPLRDAAGPALRQTWARWSASVVAPVARQIESEARAKLEVEASVDLGPLMAADVPARARAAAALAKAGVDPVEAMEIAGLMDGQ